LEHLARRLDAAAEFDAVCGPAVGGAIVGYAVAESLDRRFFLVERGTLTAGDGLYGVEYRASSAIRDQMAGLRIAVVDDAINAGSATRGAAKHIVDAGGQVTAIGAVFVLGDTPRRVAAELSAPLVGVLDLPNQIWAPEDCPLCADGVELELIPAT
jgi:orotate phosphoribosyltransferase